MALLPCEIPTEPVFTVCLGESALSRDTATHGCGREVRESQSPALVEQTFWEEEE